jgi:5'(3')-deoxyribonucleotidase
MGLRLGIDLDGVVADFNRGWIEAYNDRFDARLAPEMVTSWDSPLELTHFPDMDAFWSWARDHGGSSVFRFLEPYPDAIDVLRRLNRDGHDVVVLTAKPDWAVHDTLEWIADHRIPTREIHFTRSKHRVACDAYLEDAPHQLALLAAHRAPEATVCRFVRPWNEPVGQTVDVHDWSEFHALVEGLHAQATDITRADDR